MLPRWKDTQVTLCAVAGHESSSPKPHTFLWALTLWREQGFAFLSAPPMHPHQHTEPCCESPLLVGGLAQRKHRVRASLPAPVTCQH